MAVVSQRMLLDSLVVEMRHQLQLKPEVASTYIGVFQGDPVAKQWLVSAATSIADADADTDTESNEGEDRAAVPDGGDDGVAAAVDEVVASLGPEFEQALMLDLIDRYAQNGEIDQAEIAELVAATIAEEIESGLIRASADSEATQQAEAGES